MDTLRPNARRFRTIARLVRRFSAAGLILLIVVPFAPPFSTCDLATFVPSAIQTNGFPDHPLSPTAIENHAAIHAAVNNRHTGREWIVPSASAQPLAPARARAAGRRTTQPRLLASPAAPLPLRI